MTTMLLALLLQAADSDYALQRQVAPNWSKPDKVDDATLEKADRSSNFGIRYAALLVRIHRSLATGTAYRSTFDRLVKFRTAGGPRGASAHVKALATSFKAAVYCSECKDGRVECPQCKGKRRVTLTCEKCKGKGRFKPPGAVAGGVTQKCTVCRGGGKLVGAACPTCKKVGKAPCSRCLGRPWWDRKCLEKTCRSGNVPCPTCGGKAEIVPPCGECKGKGRVRSPGAANANVTHKCRACDGKGKAEGQPCATCFGSPFGIGRVPCKACRGEDSGKPKFQAAQIFETQPCGACKGKGWPDEAKEEACAACAGVGVLLKPASDPSKTLN